MRTKVFIYLFLMLYALSVNAEIDYKVNKYGVMTVNFMCADETPTIEQFKSDWDKAIDIAASNPKVKQIQFKNTKNEMFVWIEKANISNSNSVYEKFVSGFAAFDEVKVVYGDSVLVTKKTPAQYHKDTYINGKLDSQFTSDWEQGYFKPSTSTFKRGNDTYTSKTYYTAPKYSNSWERPVKERKVVKKGETIKLEEIYNRK